jgi:acyl-CoA reductase-like NAD-dependent aldehyde dehydrogenase
VREYRQYIGGEWIEPGKLFDDFDPYSGAVMARIPAGTRADAASAVDAAAAAFPAWAEMPPAEKQALFLRAADVVESRRGDIVALLAEETGCAGGFAGFQVLTATRLLRQAANWGYLPVGEIIRSDSPGTFAMALRRPIGVVAGISPWNGAHVLAWRTVVNRRRVERMTPRGPGHAASRRADSDPEKPEYRVVARAEARVEGRRSVQTGQGISALLGYSGDDK